MSVQPAASRGQRVSWQRRSMYAFAAYLLASDMFDSAAMGLFIPHTPRYIVAQLTGLREWISCGFFVGIAAFIPFMLAQLRPQTPPRWSIHLVCAASFAAALLWVGTAFIASDPALDMVRFQYVRQGIEACLFMLLVAANCNDALRREYGISGRSRMWRESNRVSLK